MSYTVLYFARDRGSASPSYALTKAQERYKFKALAGIVVYDVNAYHDKDYYAVIESHTPFDAQIRNRSNWDITFSCYTPMSKRRAILAFLGR